MASCNDTTDYYYNQIEIDDSTISINSTTGALVVLGGIGFNQNLYGNYANIDNIELNNSLTLNSGIIYINNRLNVDYGLQYGISVGNLNLDGSVLWGKNGGALGFQTSSGNISGIRPSLSWYNNGVNISNLISPNITVSNLLATSITNFNLISNNITSTTLNVLNGFITNLSVGTLSGVNINISSGNSNTLEKFYTENLNQLSTTSTTFQDVINITSTSLSPSSYAIHITYQMQVSSNFLDYEVQFLLNGVQEVLSRNSNIKNTDSPVYQTFLYKSLPLGPQNLLLQYRKAGNCGSVTISNAKILLYKISVLQNFYNESLFTSSTTSQIFQSKLSGTFTLTNGTFCILFSYQINMPSSFSGYEIQLLINNSQVYLTSDTITSYTDSPIFTDIFVSTFVSGPLSYTLNYRKIDSCGSLNISNAKILIFQLD
jgi:hypothetical protein